MSGHATSQPPSLNRRMASGIGMHAAAFGLQMVAQFVLVPLFLSAWGTVVYGDWLVLFAAASLLLILDLGVQGHFANSLRLSWVRGDTTGFQRILRCGQGSYVAFVAVAVALFLAVVAVMDTRALLGIRMMDGAVGVLVLLGLSVLLLLPRGMVSAVYSARGQFTREVFFNSLLYLCQAATQIAALLMGCTPLGVAAVYFAVTMLVGWGVLLADLRRRHPDIVLRPCLPDAAERRALLMQAPLYAVPSGGIMVMQQVPVIVLGHLGAVGAVIAYTTMRTVAGLCRQVAQQVAITTGMEMAHQSVRGDSAAAARLYTATARLIGAVTGLAGGLILVLGPAFFPLWTRGTLGFDAALAAAFLATVALMGPAYGALSLLHHSARPRLVALGHLAQIALALILCWLLVPPLGAVGAALGVGAAEILALGVPSVRSAAGLLGLPIRSVLVACQGTALLALGIGTGVALALCAALPPVGVGGLLLVVAVWGALVPLPAVLGLLTAGERAALWRHGLDLCRGVRAFVRARRAYR